MSIPTDNEDKLAWCELGNRQEDEFVRDWLPRIDGVSGWINPAKQADKFATDLVVSFDGVEHPADLKSVRTPLFKARELYGIDPQYAVTINTKDLWRYTVKRPAPLVVFDVWWKVTSMVIGGSLYSVEPMHTTYGDTLDRVLDAIEASGCRKHQYRFRTHDDQGNATHSWVLDVRALTCWKEWV